MRHAANPYFFSFRIIRACFLGLFLLCSLRLNGQFARYNAAVDAALLISRDSAMDLARRPPWAMPDQLKRELSHLLLAKFFNQTELYDSAQVHLDALAPYEQTPPEWDAWYEFQDQQAITAIGRGNYDEALACHQKQLRQTEISAVSPSRIAKIYRMLGRAHYYLRDFQASSKDFQLAIDTLDAVGVKSMDLVIALQNLAALYIESGSLDTAEVLLLRSIEVRRDIGEMENATVLMAYRLLATLYGAQKRWEKAEAMFKQALAGTENMANSTLKVSVRIYYAGMLRDMGRHDEGLQMALQAQEMAKELENPEVELSVVAHLANHYQQLGRHKEAAELLSRANDVRSELYSKQIADRTSALEAAFEKERLQSTNDKLSRDKQLLEAQQERDAFANTVLWLIVAGLLGLVVLGTLLIWLRNRSRRAEEALRMHRERTAALLEGEERERNRVGRELHDSLGALLSAARMHLSILEGELQPEQEEPLGKAMSLLQDSVREVRSISHALMPEVLLRQGLYWACNDLAKRISQGGTVQLEVACSGDDSDIPQGLDVMLYRIVQELLQNTLKHGKASLIQLNLDRSGRMLRLTYRDNGIGFDPLAANKGMGLANLEARVGVAGGKLKLDTKPGAGVFVLIELEMDAWKQTQQKS